MFFNYIQLLNYYFVDSFKVNGIDIPVKVVKGLPHRTSLRFDNDTLMIETASGTLGQFDLQVLEQRKSWIAKHYPKILAGYRKKIDFLTHVTEEKKILYKGKWMNFDLVIHNKKADLLLEENKLIYFINSKKIAERSFLELACEALWNQARKEITAMTIQQAELFKFSFNNITVKYVNTKWGSCSSKRNLNFNWHAIHLREEVIRYLIIHELCHLEYMNHSEAFWSLVERCCPDYQRLDQELKSYSWLINIYERK